MEFTKQERQLLNRILETGFASHIIWEFIYLAPSAAFIVFGLIAGSTRSIVVGVATLFICRVIAVVQQRKVIPVLKSICSKITTEVGAGERS